MSAGEDPPPDGRDAAADTDRLQLALDAAGMGSFVWFPQEDRTEPDATMLALFGLSSEEELTLAQALAELIHPDDRERYADAVAAATDPAHDGRLHEEIRVLLRDGRERWVVINARTTFGGDPRLPLRMAGVAADVTERRNAEAALEAAARRHAFRVTLADALRPLGDPEEIKRTATRCIGEHLGASRVLYAEAVPGDEAAITISENYRDEVEEVTGTFRLDDFGAGVAARLRAGATVAEPDTHIAPQLTAAEREIYERLTFRAFIAVPLVKTGRLAAVLAVHQREPRAWSEDDVELVEEVADRTWSAVGLARARAEMLEMRSARERRQHEFIANAAHELRTPMAAVVAAADALSAGADRDAAARERFHEHLRTATARLERLSDSLLLLAQADMEPVPLEPVDVGALVRAVAAGVHAQPGVDVIVEAPAALEAVANEALLERVLVNLAENAAKHTGAGTIVLRAAVVDGGRVRIDVIDSGEGLGNVDEARIFERFYRGEQRSPQGSGLGLSIADQAATAIGAVIAFRRLEHGTMARVTLPAARS